MHAQYCVYLNFDHCKMNGPVDHPSSIMVQLACPSRFVI